MSASSSRRQSDTRITSVGTACTCWSMSAGVRQRPSKTGWVVTQFVTQLVTSPLLAPPSRDSGDQRTKVGRHGWSDAESACAFRLGSP